MSLVRKKMHPHGDKKEVVGRRMKKCPSCAEEILEDAKKCRYCGTELQLETQT